MSSFVALQRLPGEENKNWLLAERTHVMSSLYKEKISALEIITSSGLLICGVLVGAGGLSACMMVGPTGIAVIAAFGGGFSGLALACVSLYIWQGRPLEKKTLKKAVLLHQDTQEEKRIQSLKANTPILTEAEINARIINGGEIDTNHYSELNLKL